MRDSLVTLAVILVLAAPRLLAGSTTPFRHDGGVVVPVTLNGTGPFMMLLDTGATHSTITERVAAALAAPVVAKSNVITPTAASIRPVVAVDEWEFGPVSAGVVLPTVVPDGSFDRGATIDGLIGQDVLAGLRYTIDFKRRVIEWLDDTPAPGDLELPLSFEGGRFLVSVPHAGTMVRLVPDSGADAIVLFDQSGRLPFDALETGQTVELASATLRAPARRVKIRELRLGQRIIRNLAAVAITRTGHNPAEGDGLLPLHLFERVTFDGPAKRLIVG